jgi:hypothetical protein
MAETVYILCALASVTFAALLIRKYRQAKERLLLWTSLCFIGLALNNILLYVDLIVVEELDLAAWRGGVALGAMALLLYGLVWESRP